MKFPHSEVVRRSNGGIGTPSSLRSSDTPDDLSLSPSSCPTPSDPDADLSYTVGVTENTPYGCQFCDKAFPRLSYLKRHEQVHSDQMPFRCDYCQRLFKHKRSRDRHVKLHTGDRKYRCPHCESAFSRSDHLKIHMKTHDNAKPYQCTVCNRGYNTAAALSSHMQNHKKEGSEPTPLVPGQAFRCGQCGAPFSSAGDLQNHVTRQCRGTPSPESKPVPCVFCPQLCSSPDALRQHVSQAHPSEPQGRCPMCLEDLATHEGTCRQKKMHEENQLETRLSPGLRLTCGFCSKTDFPTLESLQLHVQVLHVPVSDSLSGMRPLPPHPSHKHHHHSHPHHQGSGTGGLSLANSSFDCEFCSATFSSVQSLQKHTLTTHTFSEVLAQKRVEIYCSQCSMGFPSSNALLDHVHTVHEASPNAITMAMDPTSTPSASNASPPIITTATTVNPKGSSKRTFAGSRLRPNGTKHVKSSAILGHSPPIVFNGNTPHYRRHETGGATTIAGTTTTTTTTTATTNNESNATTSAMTTLLCSQCNAAFPDFESFRTHLKSHLESAAVVVQRFTCTECEGEFDSEQLFDAHTVSHFLAASTEYGCQSCLKLFSKPDELQKHLLDIHSHHLYRCALCKEMFDSKVSIQVHFAVKHSNECRTYKCTSCSAIFRSELEFQVHVKLSHLSAKPPQPFRCLLCDQFFTSEAQLQFHMATHKKQFRCTLCDEAFHVEFLLDRHVQTAHANVNSISPEHPHLPFHQQLHQMHHPTDPMTDVAQNLSVKRATTGSRGEQQVITTINNNIASNSPSTTTMSSTSGDGRRDFRCDICDSYFSSESSLNVHRRQTHNIRVSQKGSQPAVSLFCAYCNESCKSRSDLENHMKAHTASPSKHKCNICDEICPTAATLAEHKLTHCKVVAGSTCIVCRVPLSTEDQFYGHVQQHNAHGLPVPCVVCRQTLITDVEVQMHAKFHLKNCEPHRPCCVCSRCFEVSNLIITGKIDSGGHTYMCKECFHSKSDDPRCAECGVKFETIVELNTHRRTAHKKTYQCIKCQMSFDSESEIQAHVTCHVLHEGTSHECRLCHKVLDSPAKLQCHLIEHTFEGCSNFTCYMCSAVFTGSHLLQQHMLEHGLDTRPYDCSKCHQRFFFRAELENHAFAHHEEPSRAPIASETQNNSHHQTLFKCSLCPLVFQDSTEMQQHHFQSHNDSDLHESKCFPCGECGKEFPCMSNLQGHMRLHARGAKHTCPECHKEFALSRNLHVHMRSHSGEKPYECPVCKKRFARKENRKAHLKSHAGLKPFMCPHCGKTFSRRSHVKEHMRIHITSTTHPCETCSETFPSTRLLRRHLVDAHQKHFDHVCTVCGDVFEHAKSLDTHLQKNHEVRISNVESSADELSESSRGQSSPSGDAKDSDGSECASIVGVDDAESRYSPVSVTEEAPGAASEVAA